MQFDEELALKIAVLNYGDYMNTKEQKVENYSNLYYAKTYLF